MKTHTLPRQFLVFVCALSALALAGCAHVSGTAATTKPVSSKDSDRRYTYTPRPYPVDERGFSPVDKALAKAYASEEKITNDEEGSLNPYVLKVISGYPLDGSYSYHCGWNPREYDIYNGVTQDLWFRGMVVAKAFPDGSRCSYCCGFTFEVFVRAMKLRNIQSGLDPDDFNGMTFHDLFNALQLWYIEGDGDSEQRAIVSYGLGRAITNFDDARPGDFLSYSTKPAGGHSVVFLGWLRDENGKITGLKYFSSNLSGTHGVGYGQAHFSDSTRNGHGCCGTRSKSATLAPSRITSRFIAWTFPSAMPTRPRSRNTSYTCLRRGNDPPLFPSLTCAPGKLRFCMLGVETSRVAAPASAAPTEFSLGWKQIADAVEPFRRKVAARLAAQTEEFEPQIAVFAQYALTAQGKQLRPMLVSLSGESLGELNDSHLTVAVIIEMVHLATLVHDDVIDEAQLRRGRLTLMANWGNEVSVLLGDCLFAHALKLAASFPTPEICRAVASATNTVCAGEILQTCSPRGFQRLPEPLLQNGGDENGGAFRAFLRFGRVF